MIRARSREQGAAGGEYDPDAGNGTQGQAAARGRAGVEWVGTPVTAGMVAELPGGGKDFGSDASDQKTEVGGQR